MPEDESKREVFPMVCPSCKAPVLGTTVGTVRTKVVFVRHKTRGNSMRDKERIALIRCNSCGMPMVASQRNEIWRWETISIIWPPQDREVSEHVPGPIRADFEEARGCFRHAHYNASAVMVRRTLEGVCQDQGATKKNLAAALAELDSAGKIDSRLIEWANELRIIGNMGAHHSSEEIRKSDVGDAISFTEALLDYLYVLTAEFEAFKTRRASGAADPVAEAGPEPFEVVYEDDEPPF